MYIDIYIYICIYVGTSPARGSPWPPASAPATRSLFSYNKCKYTYKYKQNNNDDDNNNNKKNIRTMMMMMIIIIIIRRRIIKQNNYDNNNDNNDNSYSKYSN